MHRLSAAFSSRQRVTARSFLVDRGVDPRFPSLRFSNAAAAAPSAATAAGAADAPLARIRNIGIIAHIDAGKTTATERMLFFGGFTKKMGEVHDSNTVTDFMPQERERGITIKAAAITFGWRPSDPGVIAGLGKAGPAATAASAKDAAKAAADSSSPFVINLIDTPGHVDFTVEVERSMRVLDGAVALYDAVAGVQAQSETVWSQADRYSVPRIGFVNKMDRAGASYESTAAKMRARLGAAPLLLHLPLGEGDQFCGVVDLVTCEVVVYDDKEGSSMRRLQLLSLLDAALRECVAPGGSKANAAALPACLTLRRVATAPASGPCSLRQVEVVVSTVCSPDREKPFAIDVASLVELAAAGREALLDQLAAQDDALADAFLTLSSGDGSGASSSAVQDACAAAGVAGVDAASLSLLLAKAPWLTSAPGSARKAAGGTASLLHAATAEGALPELTPEAAAASEAANLRSIIRAMTIAPGSRTVPLLAGSAYKNKGVQGLLDAVLAYLPSPLDKAAPAATSVTAAGAGAAKGSAASQPQPALLPTQVAIDEKTGEVVPLVPSASAPLRALAFKVQNHPTKGPLVFFRVYSGVLSGRLPLLNLQTGAKERPSKLLQVLADEHREVESVSCGHIAAATGLKSVRTGDTLLLAGDPKPARLLGLTLPQPVFTASVEVDSQSEEKALAEALEVMQREDPSLHVKTDPDTGQLLISGMGELHLNIALDRLRREHNVAARLGRMMVAFREAPAAGAAVETVHVTDKTVGGKRAWAQLAFSMTRLSPEEAEEYAEATAAAAAEAAALKAMGSASGSGGGKGKGKNKGKDGRPAAAAPKSAVGVADGASSAGDDAAADAGGVIAEDAVPLLTVFENDLEDAHGHGHGDAKQAAAASQVPAREHKLLCRILSDAAPAGGKPVPPPADVDAEDAEQMLQPMPPKLAAALREAIASAMGRGPILGYPLAGLRLRLLEDQCVVSAETTPAAIRYCVAGALQAALDESGSELLEPVMSVEISIPSASVGGICNDVTSRRRGRIIEISSPSTGASTAAGKSSVSAAPTQQDKMVVRAFVPLREMVGYADKLRSSTAGEGSFSMEFSHYAHVGDMLQRELKENPSLI